MNGFIAELLDTSMAAANTGGDSAQLFAVRLCLQLLTPSRPPTRSHTNCLISIHTFILQFRRCSLRPHHDRVDVFPRLVIADSSLFALVVLSSLCFGTVTRWVLSASTPDEPRRLLCTWHRYVLISGVANQSTFLGHVRQCSFCCSTLLLSWGISVFFGMLHRA